MNFHEQKKNNINKEKLKEIYKIEKKNKKDVAIELTVPTREDTEIIIVKFGNLDYKLDYYLKNYNDKLELNRCVEVKILSAELVEWGV